ncbi:uncharacterized protein TNCV_3846321 [Trichonephila clavipes]|nr:uncharacterized protein TNCV_3846321 [Trichonephila clavipes]
MTVCHFYTKHAAPKHNLDYRKQCMFSFGWKYWPYGQKNCPENVNHVAACLQRFLEDAKINEEEDESETEEEEPKEEVSECSPFQPVPREMQGRHKDRSSEYVGSRSSQDTYSCESETPDYDDFIDMFRVPTPVSPLPPTPVASPSHEQSQDLIYDSLPPMERSMVPMSPLKICHPWNNQWFTL